MYVGMESHAHRLEDQSGKEKKKEKNDMGEKQEKVNKKKIRKVEDGLLLVVSTKIYGKTV